MAIKYYGWLGLKGYNGLVKIKDNSEAYVYNKKEKDFRRNDTYLKAAFDPGSEFEEISAKEAEALLKELAE